jgi:probable rRNA maturation factor
MPRLTGRIASRKPQPEAAYHISVQIQAPFRSLVSPEMLADAARAALTHENVATGRLSLLVTNDDEVQRLNNQFRFVDAPTDVLSFPTRESAGEFVSIAAHHEYLGDIVIAYPFTERQTAAAGRDLRRELQLLAIHGVLHLLGLDHADEASEADMWRRQDEILAGLP